MRKQVLLLVVIIIFPFVILAQSCLPDGITFTNQSQIDDFQTNYPGCSEIEGNVQINGADIVNLNGLSVLISISGNLYIGSENYGNQSLINLAGLQNLTSIGGNFSVIQCNSLTNLMGLNNLTTIEGGTLTIRGNSILENLVGLENLASEVGLDINFNWGLTSLDGLNNLNSLLMLNLYHNEALMSIEALNNVTTVEGIVHIILNESLTSLSGLNNLISIGDRLRISENFTLDSIISLNNLTTIGGRLTISYNSSLTSLDGLDNIEPNSITHLSISNNGSLSNCEVQSICNYLSNPYGIVSIFSNASGCNSPPEIANSCGITLSCLPYGDYYLINQTEIDSFQINYPNCTELAGLVFIKGSNITNLLGLNPVTSIGSHLAIFGNHILTSLDGLENLTSIHGSLFIGGYNVWPYYGEGNNLLADLNGLQNLTTIGYSEDIFIVQNPSLSSLSGLDSIESSLIYSIEISENDLLTECEVYSICNFLAANGNAEIYYNSSGCNSVEEVEEACLVKVYHHAKPDIIIYPNPTEEEIRISNNNIIINEVVIYNQLGQKVLHKRNLSNSVDISELVQGIYIIDLISNGSKTRQKLIIK